jgi:tape measure domain-containing protein
MPNIGNATVRVSPDMTGIQSKVAAGFKGSGTKVAESLGLEISGKGAVIVGALAGIASTAANKAMSLITNSVGAAIKRVDTLNNSAKTFEYMGFAAADSKKATDELSKSIKGLPTPLDSAMRGMTALAATYGDVRLGQKVFSSLNNAILGFGGSAFQVENAITQISQLPLDGPLDAQTWNSLRNSGLTPVLNAMAKESGMSMSAMKKAFGEGKLTVQDFTDNLITMNTKGGGGLASLEKIAKTATGGIGTGIANMQTAVTRGVANIIEAFGAANISGAITKIGDSFETILNVVAKTIPKVIAYVKSLVDFVVKYKDIFAPIAVGAAAAVAALLAFNTVMKVVATIQAIQKALLGAQTAFYLYKSAVAQGIPITKAFNAAFNANPIAIAVVALAALTAGLIYFFTQTETGRKIFANFVSFMGGVWEGLKSGVQSVGEFFSGVWDKINGAISVTVEAFNIAKAAVTGFVSDAIDKLNGALQATIGWIEENSRLLTNIGIIIGTLVAPKLVQLGVQATVAAAKWVAGMAQIVASTVVAGAKSAAAFVRMGVSATVNAVKAGAAWVKNAALATAAWLKALPKVIAQFAVAAASSVKNAVIAGAAWVKQAALAAAGWAKTFAVYALGVAKAALTTGIAAIKMAASWLLAMGPIGLIVAAVAGAVALIIANWDSVKTFVAGVWDWITNAVSNAINWIKANWPLILAILTGPIGLAVLAIVKNWDTIKAAFQAAWNFIKGVWSKVAGWFGGVWNGIKNVFSGVSGWFRGIFQSAWNGITGIWNKVGSFFSGIWGKIKDAFNGVKDLGKNIVQGLWNGINDMVGWIGGKIKGFGDSVLSGIKNFFGIKSPSRVMRDQVGKMIGQGVGIGITKSTKDAVKAAQASSSAIEKAFDVSPSANIATASRQLTTNATLYPGSEPAVSGQEDAVQRPPVNIENITIESDYDADRLLKVMGVKQGLYAKGVM